MKNCIFVNMSKKKENQLFKKINEFIQKYYQNQLIKGGIYGFPKRSESEYDTFGVGHSSTSISASLGMAVANRYLGKKNKHHIAVIGDGAMTAGLAFEGLNHAGYEKDTNLLVILNISPILYPPSPFLENFFASF